MIHNILAVEPDKLDRYLLKRSLAPEFNISTLSSATEAIAFAKCNSFDVAIVNLKLVNHFDGIGLISRLKQINPAFTPIATTVMVDELICQSLTATGFCEVISKPVTGSGLKDVLRSIEFNQRRRIVA